MPPTEPLVSVITPAYNVELFIQESIDSVLAQTEGNFEYLIVDDGSTDATKTIIENAAAQDPRVRLIQGAHAGSGAARNLGIGEARGKYIAFLDGDDRWDPKFLELLIEALESAPESVGAVFCQTRIIDEAGRVYWRRYRSARDYDFDALLVQDCPPGNGSALLLRKSCFDEAGLFDEDLKSAVDFDMWLRIARDASTPTFRGVRHCLVDLRVRRGAISRDLTGRLTSMQKLLDRFIPSLRHTPAPLAYVRPTVVAFRAGNDEVAERWLKEARKAELPWLLKDSYGRRVLLWGFFNRRQRNVGRMLSAKVKQLVIRSLSLVSSSLRGVANRG